MPPQVQHKTKLVEAIKGTATIINGRTTKLSEREWERKMFCYIMGYVIAKKKKSNMCPRAQSYALHMTHGP